MSELKHYGVLGMKWGIRRYQPYGEGGYNPKRKGIFKSKQSDAMRKAREADINKLSDQELRNINNRLHLEEDYRRLTKKGISKTQKTIIAVGGTLLGSLGSSYVMKIGQPALAASLGIVGAISVSELAKVTGVSPNDIKNTINIKKG